MNHSRLTGPKTAFALHQLLQVIRDTEKKKTHTQVWKSLFCEAVQHKPGWWRFRFWFHPLHLATTQRSVFWPGKGEFRLRNGQKCLFSFASRSESEINLGARGISRWHRSIFEVEHFEVGHANRFLLQPDSSDVPNKAKDPPLKRMR